jgi:hypothetical protein
MRIEIRTVVMISWSGGATLLKADCDCYAEAEERGSSKLYNWRRLMLGL